MPRVRFRLPLEIEVTPEQLDAGRALGDAMRKGRDVLRQVNASGLVGAVLEAADKTRAAVRSRARRRPGE